MTLNLVTDPWIPVRCTDGSRKIIAPWQVAEPGIAFPDWPRADLNIACLELLIGLVRLVDPPEDEDEWQDRQSGDPERLRTRLADVSEAFELLGDGPRFMQDADDLNAAPNSPDMLFIDSAGGQTIRNNADLMVWRGRYPTLDLPLAAMALYAFQSFAPSGGAGNRTSMRGGGPMVTLIDPGHGLWSLIWANVPDGEPGAVAHLPWMRPTRTSEKGQQVFPEQVHPVEAFFGMPRRLRLVADSDLVTGVIQRPYGTNYAGWAHPLSPYYRLKSGAEWLPKHPRAGSFGYHHWLGVVAAEADDGQVLKRRAEVVRAWPSRGDAAQLIVAGWAMDNMKPRDFILSRQPYLRLDRAGQMAVAGMIRAADKMSLALRASLAVVLAEGEAREAVREEFFLRTAATFEQMASAPVGQERDWVATMARTAMTLFEARALKGVAERDSKEQAAVVSAHGRLRANLRGQGKYGKAAFADLGLESKEEHA